MEPNQTFQNSQGWRKNKQHPLQPSGMLFPKIRAPAQRQCVKLSRGPGSRTDPASLCSAAANPRCRGQGRGFSVFRC